MGRTIGILLALSLAANVFLGGFVAGRIAAPNLPGFGPDRGNERHDGRGGGRHDFDDLSPAAREKFRALFRENRREIAAAFREDRAQLDEFFSVLTAETFDRAAAEAVAAKLDVLEDKRRRAIRRLAIEVMDGLSLEDRRAVADLVKRRMTEDMAGAGERRRWRGGRGEAPSQESGPPTE